MKHLLLALCVFTAAAVNAQFGGYIKAGANYSNLRIIKGYGVQSSQGEVGWVAGGGAEYHIYDHNYFFFFGLELAQQNFKKDSASSGFQSVVSKYSYHPIYANFPFGVSYQFDLTGNLGLKLTASVT